MDHTAFQQSGNDVAARLTGLPVMAADGGRYLHLAIGQRIALFNLGGKYYAIEDRCPIGADPYQRECWQRMRLSARGTVPDSK